MPVCVRCFGIYLGLIIGTLIYPLFKKLNNTEILNIKYLWIFLFPIIFDGLCQTFHLYPSPHYIRLITGILASGGLVFYALPLFNKILTTESMITDIFDQKQTIVLKENAVSIP